MSGAVRGDYSTHGGWCAFIKIVLFFRAIVVSAQVFFDVVNVENVYSIRVDSCPAGHGSIAIKARAVSLFARARFDEPLL